MPGLRLSVAGKFISFVAIEIASGFQLFAESLAGAVQANLDGIEADTEDLGNLAVFKFLQFAQHHYGFVCFGKAVHELAETFGHLFANNRRLDRGSLLFEADISLPLNSRLLPD